MRTQYLSEEDLVQKVQSGEYGWHEYIEHHSKELAAEYADYCQSHGLDPSEEESAAKFMEQRDKEFEQAMERGDA